MSEFVSLPVPVHLYESVMRFIADEMRSRGEEGASSDPAPDLWSTPQRLAMLSRSISTTMPMAILRATAAQPDSWVSLRDVCAAENVEPKTAAAELGGFTKLLKSQFGTSRWPVDVRQGPAGEGAQYRMRHDVAARWQEAAGWLKRAAGVHK